MKIPKLALHVRSAVAAGGMAFVLALQLAITANAASIIS